MPPAKSAGSSRRILIVEDERPLAHALELKLAHEGYETEVAATGTDALAKAQRGGFHLILLDVILPELDGFSLLKQLREKGMKTPVIILSNLGQDSDRAKAKELGVEHYLVKSNTPLADIVRVIHDLLAH